MRGWLARNGSKKLVHQKIIQEDIDSMSDCNNDDFEVVDPPDDAYAMLTSEQQIAIRRLMADFIKMNKSLAYI